MASTATLVQPLPSGAAVDASSSSLPPTLPVPAQQVGQQQQPPRQQSQEMPLMPQRPLSLSLSVPLPLDSFNTTTAASTAAAAADKDDAPPVLLHP
jgi:hypothetical protein